jgi:hypothetical protein
MDFDDCPHFQFAPDSDTFVLGLAAHFRESSD